MFLKSTVLGAGFLYGGAEYNKEGGGGCDLPLHQDGLPNQRGTGTDPKALSPSKAGLSWVSEAKWPAGESEWVSKLWGQWRTQSSHPGYVTTSGKQIPCLHRHKKSLGNVRPTIRLNKENKVDPTFAIYFYDAFSLVITLFLMLEYFFFCCVE